MKAKQIQAGKTYVGKNGRRRTVNHLVSVGGVWCVNCFDHHKRQTWSGIRLSEFANWARKEEK